jgi:hypothetical protein
MGLLQGKKAKPNTRKEKNKNKNVTTSGKKKNPNKQIGTKGTTLRGKSKNPKHEGKKKWNQGDYFRGEKKKQQKQTKPNTDKRTTTAGPLRTKRKPINK